MYFSISALVTLASAVSIAVAAKKPEFDCPSDAILVCCEEFTGSVIGQYVGEGSGCMFHSSKYEAQLCTYGS